ncbi:MAG: hypothetical protein JJE13_04405 [Thermoleophilia bacterium]|nr:hypothetical protein [Thermoleophilia bacterium]
MLHPRRIASLILVGMLSLAAFGILNGTASAARPLDTGVTTIDIGAQEQLGFDRIREAGATFTRVTIFWDSVAPNVKPDEWSPTNPGDSHYDWTATDSTIQKVVAAGLKPLVQVFKAPRWAERCRTPNAGVCNPDPKQFARFAAAAVARYSGDFGGLPRVRYWEPLNEPNLAMHFMPQYRNGKSGKPVSVDLYRNLLNQFADVVKGVDPGNVVVAGGLAPLGGSGSPSPLDFTRRLLCMKGRAHPRPIPGCTQTARFDVWAHSAYTSGGPTHESVSPDDVQLGDLREMARLIRKANAAGNIRTHEKSIPFWITEFSWDSAPPDPGGVPMGLLTRWTAEAMFRSWQAGVSKFFWLSLRDWKRPAGLPYSQTIDAGLYFRGPTVAGDRPKRVLKAFSFPFVAFSKPKGIAIWGRTPDSTAGKVKLSFRAAGSKNWKKLATVNANRTGVFSDSIETRLGRHERGLVKATYEGNDSPAFSLKPVRDHIVSPFGDPVSG